MQFKKIWSLSLLFFVLGCQSAQKGSTLNERELIRSEYGNKELSRMCDNEIAKAEQRIEDIAKLKSNELNIDNSLLALEEAFANLQDASTPLAFMKYVSPKAELSAEANECEQKVSNFVTKTLGRRDLYNAIKSQKPRNANEARLLAKTIEAFEANGLKLPDAKLKKVTELLTKLNELQVSFGQNLNNDSTSVEFTAEELEGVPADAIQRLKKSADGKAFIASTKVTDYLAITENAKNPETRKKMLIAYSSRQAVPNTKLLEEAILLRQEVARLLGFKTWADYQLSTNRMAKDSKTVFDFLGGLRKKLAAQTKKDLAQLLKFKKSMDRNANRVEPWDINYLNNQLKKRDYSLDDEVIKEYFPSDQFIKNMFAVYSEILGVNYEQVANPKTWHKDVQLYRIVDKNSKKILGYFFTDFIPRQGKYSHFAAFTLLSGRQLAKDYSVPVSAIVGNFTPPTGNKPSLLTHDEVITAFHEFGHIMHQTLTRAPYASLSGTSVARDFVEAPSQMLEEWGWQKKILDRVSGHYQDPGKKLPEELLTKLLAARKFQRSYFYTRQLMLALTDLTYHTKKGRVDTAAVYRKLYKELLGVEPLKEGNFAATFGHLMGGYDAGYYGYLWSEVLAADMFTAFASTDILSPQVGARYRSSILEKGNMQEPTELVQEFLQRKPNNKAFLKKLSPN